MNRIQESHQHYEWIQDPLSPVSSEVLPVASRTGPLASHLKHLQADFSIDDSAVSPTPLGECSVATPQRLDRWDSTPKVAAPDGHDTDSPVLTR